MIDELIRDLKRDEGWRPSAYQDHVGFWTIGYGFLIDERRGGELPKPIAELWLERAAARRWNELARERPFLLTLPEDVQRALANMAYQLGVSGTLNFRKMLPALERFDFETAAREALDSEWARQTPARARRAAALIRSGTGRQ